MRVRTISYVVECKGVSGWSQYYVPISLRRAITLKNKLNKIGDKARVVEVVVTRKVVSK